jgi:glycosyltransferase involved in cell wall biosynthesis
LVTSGSVLQVVATAERRGAEVFAVDLEPCLRRRGWEVCTVALCAGRAPNLEIPRLGTTPLGISTLRALRTAVHDADVVVAHGSSTLPACALTSLGVGVSPIYRNIGDPTHWSGSPLRRARVAFAFRRMAHIVALTDGAAATIATGYHVGAQKLTVIPSGVSATRFHPASAAERRAARRALRVSDDAFVALGVGALSEEKGVDLAIEAVARSPEVDILLLAGDGVLRTQLEAQVRVRAPDRVRFLGSLADTVPLYAAADVVVLASRTEGLPGVLIEAGLAGVPAIATDVGYVADIVRDGLTGVLCPSGDVDALAAAFRRVREEGGALGAAAHEHCLVHFELERVADRWSDVIARVTA